MPGRAGRQVGANPFGAGPIGLAHRAGAGEGVENSPSAIQHAVDLGYRWIETDVRATRDGHAMVFHDELLDRTTDSTGAIAARTRAELAGVRLADGNAPISLADALGAWPDACFNVDIKAADAIGPFLRAVAEADAWSRVCAASFSARRLRELRRHGGTQLATSLAWPEVTRLVLGRAPRVGACAAQVPATVRGAPLVSPGLVDRAHSAGLQVHVWTVNDPGQMRHLLDLGVDGIVTDRPTVLAHVLRGRG